MTPAWLAAQGSAPYLLGGSNTTYVLETNMSAPGTAFILGGSNNTLNLNGYTVTYDNAAPLTFTNSLFQQGSGRNVPGWNLSAAPSATLVPNAFYMPPLSTWSTGQVLQFANISSTQTIVSDPIAIPTANQQYEATISAASINETPVSLTVVDSVTGAVLASTPGNFLGSTVQFTPTTTNPVYLQISVNPTQTDTVELSYASLNVSRDYGVLATRNWDGMPCQLTSIPDWYTTFENAMNGTGGLTICNGSILQGQANGYNSLPIYAEGTPGLTVQNVTTLSTGIDTPAIDAYYASNVLISGCAIYSTCPKVMNRMDASLGPLIRTGVGDTVTITDNQLYGSPQSGIGCQNQSDVTITDNIIQSNTIVSDGYGIGVSGLDTFTIAGNTMITSGDNFPAWQAGHQYQVGQACGATVSGNYYWYLVTATSGTGSSAGMSYSSPPSWPGTPGQTVTETNGDVTWTCMGAPVGTSGRGILLDNSGNGLQPEVNGQVYNNYADIRRAPDPEYGLAMEPTALRFRDGGVTSFTNLSIYDNTFIARTGAGNTGPAIGARFTVLTNTLGGNLNNVIENNVFEGISEVTTGTAGDYLGAAGAVLGNGGPGRLAAVPQQRLREQRKLVAIGHRKQC